MKTTNDILNKTRTNYKREHLNESTASKNPFDQFDKWLIDALEVDKDYANAMVLSTVDINLMPDSRVVLLRNISDDGLTFFTHYNSKKGHDIKTNPTASVLFFWKELERQVRIQGKLELLPATVSDEYFDSRPFESKVGACISHQSAPIENRGILDLAFKNGLENFKSIHVTRPKQWGGYLLVPAKFEFWQGGEHRLHDRLQYELDWNKHIWSMQRLMP
ncbi:MAG: pyridoxamine 5'-phosphate oxidase [Bacteroidia bacterium]